MNNPDPQPENTEETDALRAEAHGAQAANTLQGQTELDARRYQWLRDYSDPDAQHPYIAQEQQNSWGTWRSVHLFGHEADALIDAALGEAQSEAAPGVSAESESVPQKGEVAGQPSLSEVLKEIEERVEKATPGPWQAHRGWADKFIDQNVLDVHPNWCEITGPEYFSICGHFGMATAEFLAAFRTIEPLLVKALRRAETGLREILTDSHEGCQNNCLHCGSVNETADHTKQDLTSILTSAGEKKED